MSRTLPRYVTEFADRHGKVRMRYRRKGQAQHYFQHPFGSDEFWQEYAACLSGELAPKVEPRLASSPVGSIDDLCERFYRSPGWQGMTKESSRKTYRSIIERFRKAHGSKRVAMVKVEHLDAILGKMRDTPAAANNLRKVLKRLFAYAVKLGWRRDNPVELTDAFRIDGEGFHTWTEAEIAQFQAKHPIGSKARLAMELMLWTGQRRSDIIQLGRQHVEDGRIRIRQTKTGAVVLVPISPQLQRVLDSVPAGQLCFLETEFGRPFTSAGFGNWFRDRCNEAGLRQCSAHGLRKAMSRRLAESGATHMQGKAVTGHKTDREFSRYAAAADQVALADQAVANLAAKSVANPAKHRKDR